MADDRIIIPTRAAAGLRDRIKVAAKAAGLSANEWQVRALEAALSAPPGTLPSPGVEASASPRAARKPRAVGSAPAQKGDLRTPAPSRSPGDAAAVRAAREAPSDRRVLSSAEARAGRGPIPKAGKR